MSRIKVFKNGIKEYKRLNNKAFQFCCWIHVNYKTLQWICTSDKANRGILVNRKKCEGCLIKNKNSGNVTNFKLL
jgi:hypothetical protein